MDTNAAVNLLAADVVFSIYLMIFQEQLDERIRLGLRGGA